jgi:multidrug resistance efflux pump
LKKAQARLHEARLDRARGERDAARAEIARAEANWEKAKATVAYRTKQLTRIQELVERRAVEERLLDEEKDAVNKARKAEREAEAAIEVARTRLKLAEAEAGAGDRGAITPPREAPR